MAMHPLAGALLAAGGLTDVDLTLTVATIVLFAIFAAVLAKFAWGPILRMIEEREKGIKEAVEGAEKAAADSKELLEKHREMLREAGREREEIIKKALKEADVLKADLQAKARSESEGMIARAREQVEREKNLAVLELRQQVADLAIEAASRIVKSSLTPEAQRKLVDEFVTNLPKAGAHN
jgi:F-type H+-transporting ATPase subunit b